MTKVAFLLAIFAATFSNFARGQSTCNWMADTCPWQNDGECDSPEFCDPNTDCFDCDPCAIYRFDCTSCISSDSCYWLPELGWCLGFAFQFDLPDGNFTSEDWVQTCDNIQNNVLEDPLYSTMKWSYDLINVEKVWEEGVFGNGVHIRFNDDGIDSTHPEFAGKFDSSTCSGGSEPLYIEDVHGTATASIAAGNRNDVCAVGIAPDATVSACNIANLPSFSGEFFLDANIESVDISSSSLGRDACYETGDFSFFRQEDDGECPFEDFFGFTFVCDTCDFSAELTAECQAEIETYCTYFSSAYTICLEYLDFFLACEYNTLSDGELAALTNGIANGRDGKGIIYVFSAGNEFSIGEDLNFEGWLNSRFTITVGAVGKFGEFASYSSTGSALFITAPGGDVEYATNNVVAAAGSGGACLDITIGTSFSCPVVSGVVALMLEVNPDLGWRDVQAILASTAQLNEPNDETWTTNAAGLHHSIKFGFGLVDAYAAVSAARTWQIYGPEVRMIADSGSIDLSLGDNGEVDGTVSTSVTIGDTSPGMSNFTMESVVVYLDLSHGSRGHLEITLTSPQGTESVLAPGPRPENTQLEFDETWKLMTVRSWGESPLGEWTLSISDEQPGDVAECVDLPWFFDGNITCLYIQIFETDICSDGVVLDPSLIGDETVVDENGLNPVDSCCICGGGRDAGEVVDVLKSWKLMVYGHFEALSEGPPSTGASSAPTAATSVPVTTPTEAPVSPVAVPTVATSVPVTTPTETPVSPVAIPTVASSFPVTTPTEAPVSPVTVPTVATSVPVSTPTEAPVSPVAVPTVTTSVPVTAPMDAPVSPVAETTLVPVITTPTDAPLKPIAEATTGSPAEPPTSTGSTDAPISQPTTVSDSPTANNSVSTPSPTEVIDTPTTNAPPTATTDQPGTPTDPPVASTVTSDGVSLNTSTLDFLFVGVVMALVNEVWSH